MEQCCVIVQSKDEDKSNQKGSMEVSFPTEDSRGAADQDEQSCAAGGLEVSSSRSGTTSERRVTRAAARSQQQRGRSSADGMITHIRAHTPHTHTHTRLTALFPGLPG